MGLFNKPHTLNPDEFLQAWLDLDEIMTCAKVHDSENIDEEYLWRNRETIYDCCHKIIQNAVIIY